MRIAPGHYGMRVIELRRHLACQPDDYVVVVDEGLPDGLTVMREDGLTVDARICFVEETTTGVDRPSVAQQVDEGGEA